jgi:hypothetical protein
MTHVWTWSTLTVEGSAFPVGGNRSTRRKSTSFGRTSENRICDLRGEKRLHWRLRYRSTTCWKSSKGDRTQCLWFITSDLYDQVEPIHSREITSYNVTTAVIEPRSDLCYQRLWLRIPVGTLRLAFLWRKFYVDMVKCTLHHSSITLT